MSKNIKTADGSSSDDAEFDVYFPEFILALRDFTLELKFQDKEVSSDEYLEYCLKAKEGDSKDVQRFNEPRLCIRKYFKKRKCFVFGLPAGRRKLNDLDRLTDDDLNEDFVEDTNMFLAYVNTQTVPMKLKNGTPVTGRMFCSLAHSYVGAISRGAIPCIQSALRYMAMTENENAVNKALSIYCSEMSANVSMPTQTEQELRDIHVQSKGIAFEHFLRRRVLDDDETYKQEFDARVKEEYQKLISLNEQKSTERCEQILPQLHEKISDNINAGVYAVPGGYEIYIKDREELKRKFEETTGLGVMKNEAYVTYVHIMKSESEAILKSDQKLTEEQRVLHLERESKGRAEDREAMLQKKMQESYKEMTDMKAQHDKEFNPFPNDKTSRCSDLKAAADNKIKIENHWICVKYSIENIEAKGETAGYQQFLLLSQCFPQSYLLGTSKAGLVWERVKRLQETHTKELANERARLDDIAEKRIMELSRVQSENLHQVQDRYEKELNRLQESQKDRDKIMKESMDRMSNELQEIIKDNKEKEKRLTELNSALECEKRAREHERRRRKKRGICVIS